MNPDSNTAAAEACAAAMTERATDCCSAATPTACADAAPASGFPTDRLAVTVLVAVDEAASALVVIADSVPAAVADAAGAALS
jgi:hypothetical protein